MRKADPVHDEVVLLAGQLWDEILIWAEKQQIIPGTMTLLIVFMNTRFLPVLVNTRMFMWI